MECEYERRKKCDSLYIERYNKLLKENKELKSIMADYIKTIRHNRDEIDRLNNIIKEVKEYINDRFYIDKETGAYCLTHTFDSSNLYELLKILDKGE